MTFISGDLITTGSADATMKTTLCHMLGIEYPIIAAPMGPDLTGPELVAAVSNAGGPRYPASAVLHAATLPRGDPSDSGTDRQAVRCESAFALPDRRPGGRLFGGARPHSLALLG